MPSRKLNAADLTRPCDLSGLKFKTTDELGPLPEMLGQPRAVEAVQFGIEIGGDGYNIFAMGPPGTGKRTLVEQYLRQRAPQEPTPDDWCYVNNFDNPQKPRAVRLPAGRGPEFKYDMEQLVEDVRRVVPTAFESDEYRQRREALEQESFAEPNKALEAVHARAETAALKVAWTPTGIVFTPTLNGEPMTPEQVDQLPKKEREAMQERAERFQEEIIEIMQQAPRVQRAARQKLKELNRDVARRAFEPLLNELRVKYGEMPQVLGYLDAVKDDLMENAEALIRAHSEGERPAMVDGAPVAASWLVESAVLRSYRVNVLVTHAAKSGAPVVFEENPTHENLIGRVEHLSQMGTLVTDFTLIRTGALLQANGGYLVLHADKVLMNPFSWDALKRALRGGEVKIESLGQAIGIVSTVSLEPEPVPLKAKVVLLGTRLLYYLLREYDAEFADLVKVPADFASDMDRAGNEETYAHLIAAIAKRCELRPFDRPAVARVIEHSARLSGDAEKLTVHLRGVRDLLRESEHFARKAGSAIVGAADVQRAIEAQVYRTGRMQEELREMTTRNILLLDVDGARVGQVNGIAVFPFGDLYYGHPSRITARVRLGDGNVIDIEREVELGGALHSKGVLILQGYIAGRYAQDLPLSLSASLVFEQSYGPISGDSASSAELYALLSAIALLPIDQSFAVTGSVNQHGQVQAIGAVNEKIEGYFDVCKAKGLSGRQGVIIPASNVQHLMLREDVIEAVRAGRFHLHAVETIDEGMEILTGLAAGEADTEGNYPENTINALIMARLEDLAAARKEFGPGGAAESGEGGAEGPSDVAGDEVPRTTPPR
jgi:predicted ATP-dependent protease